MFFLFIEILFYGVFITISPKAFAWGVLCLFFLGINSLDFLLYHFKVSLEFLNLTVHFFYQTIALFTGCVEETEVVLVRSNLAAQLVVAAQEFATLIAECCTRACGADLRPKGDVNDGD